MVNITDPDVLFFHNVSELKRLQALMPVSFGTSAAIIRKLLVDSPTFLSIVNRKRKLKIMFSMNTNSGIAIFENILINSIPQTKIQNLPRTSNTFSFTIDQFLRFHILTIRESEFSVLDVIKEAANKAGGVHFETTETKLSAALTKYGGDLVSVLAQVMSVISGIVIVAMDDLYHLTSRFPSYDKFIAHYGEENGALVFQGSQHLVTENMKAGEVDNGLCAIFHINIDNQINNPSSVYTMVGVGNCWKLEIKILDCSLVAEISDTKRKISLPSVHLIRTGYYKTWMALTCSYCLTNEGGVFSLLFDKYLMAEDKSEPLQISSPVGRHVIGADEFGENGASFESIEIILLKSSIFDEETNNLIEYLILKRGNS